MRYAAVRVHNELIELSGDLTEVYLVVDTEFLNGSTTEGWAVSRHLSMDAAKAAADLLNP